MLCDGIGKWNKNSAKKEMKMKNIKKETEK